jgi:hypothetical protein
MVKNYRHTKSGKNIGNCKREALSHIQKQAHQNNSRFHNRNFKISEGMECGIFKEIYLPS